MDIDASFYNAIDLLKKLIAIPSYSREEKAAADALESYMNDLHLHPFRKGNNIGLLSPDWDERKPVILLNSHIDTVKPVAGWTKNPLLPEEDGDYLFGLGSNDAGASLVSLLYSFLTLTQREQPNNFIFLASCEEEISGANGIASVLPELPAIDFALVGEPTNMQPAIAERGLMVLDGIVVGQAGHAARDEGDNAIYKAIPVIRWFKETQFPLKSDLLGAVKMTVTMVNAGTQHNVIPGECRFTVDVRSNEHYTNRALFDWIAAHCGCEITARSFRLNSSGISTDHPFVRRAMLLGRQPFGSPTTSDQAQMPFPSLKMGPGQSSRSHTADEYILYPEIREAMELYIRLLDQLNL
ncbi:MAG: M20 family metallo-hydrolase [Dysgonamonadaceae bacterium]|jgi:acetylornithine deacetylase|nr:M20 family metallo-hydrolase [Dysgonamonadaceae bacterium]